MPYEGAAPAVVMMPCRSTPCSASKRRAIEPVQVVKDEIAGFDQDKWTAERLRAQGWILPP